MKKPLLVALGVALTAGLALSGAASWRALKTGHFPLSSCSGASFDLASALVPGFDSAELREGDGRDVLRVMSTAGKPCSRARDRERCEAAVAGARSAAGWNNGSNGRVRGHRYLVATRGDEVVLIDGHTLTLGAALAPIDSPEKAAAVASVARSLTLVCERSARKVEGGFEIHLSTTSCFGPRDEVILVKTDGSVVVVKQAHEPATCVG